jgi:hypothetical protein
MGLTALGLCMLCAPSKWWLLPMAPISTIGAVFLIYESVVFPKHRAVTFSFFAGIGSYFAICHFIQMGFFVWDELDTWWSFIGPLWTWQHGEIPVTKVVHGYDRADFLSYVITTHLILAILFSAISTAIVHTVVSRRAPRSAA